MSYHFMIPGTHELPRTPQCKCGAEWDFWADECTAVPALPDTKEADDA